EARASGEGERRRRSDLLLHARLRPACAPLLPPAAPDAARADAALRNRGRASFPDPGLGRERRRRRRRREPRGEEGRRRRRGRRRQRRGRRRQRGRREAEGKAAAEGPREEGELARLEGKQRHAEVKTRLNFSKKSAL